jgi:hypothetical protein
VREGAREAVELVVWGLELYGRYVATVLILGSSVALAVWLASFIASWSNGLGQKLDAEAAGPGQEYGGSLEQSGNVDPMVVREPPEGPA